MQSNERSEWQRRGKPAASRTAVSIERAMQAELAMAVYKGIVIEVYRINNWYPAGTLEYQYRDDPYSPIYKDRWEFDGEIAEDIRDEYIGKSVEVGRFPVGYVNL